MKTRVFLQCCGMAAALVCVQATTPLNASTELFNDVWAYYVDTGEWVELQPSGTPPAPAHGRRATYDPINQRMVMHSHILTLSGELEAWEPRGESGGEIIGWHYFPNSNTLYYMAHNGAYWWNFSTDEDGVAPMNSWTWTGLTGSSVVDQARNRAIDFGIGRLVSYTVDTSGVTAAEITQSGEIPTVRDLFRGVVDPVRDRMIIFGGNTSEHGFGDDYRGETFELDLSTDTWFAVTPDTSPSPRGQYASAWDPVESRWYIFCGLYRVGPEYTNISTYNDVWAYDSATQTWQEQITIGEPPKIRRQPSAVFDEQNRRVILFGGEMVNGPPPSRAVLQSPRNGRRVSGNRVTLVAELTHGTPDNTGYVRFQYRAPSGSGGWTDIDPANPNHSNPDTTHPYFVHWDVTGFADGPVDLRVVAASSENYIDPAPEYITITIDHANPDSSEESDEQGRMIASYRTSGGFGDFETTDGSGNLRVRYAPDSMPADGRLQVSFDDSARFTERGFETMGFSADLSLVDSATSTRQSGGNEVVVLIRYTDNDTPGVIDGTDIPIADVGIIGLDDAGNVVPVANVVVDQTRKQVRGTASSLGQFTLGRLSEEIPTHTDGWIMYH